MDFCELANNIYRLIIKEIEEIQKGKGDLQESYPKLVISLEFFRFIRGEFFHASRSPGLFCQARMYEMEKDLTLKTEELKQKIDFNSSKMQYFLNLEKKMFEK